MAKILVVDDDSAQRAQLQNVLENAGYVVATCPDAIEGLVAITRDPPDLILSDILMPRMDGFTFIREVKSRPDLRVIPFLFITSTVVSEEDRQFAQMLGAEAIIARAGQTESTLEAIGSCLKRRARGSPSLLDRALPRPPEEGGEPAAPPAPGTIEAADAPTFTPPDRERASSTEQEQAVLIQQLDQAGTALEARVAELEEANRQLEKRAEELTALAAARDVQLQKAQAQAKHLETYAAERARYLASLSEISRRINSAVSLDPVLDEIVQRANLLLRTRETSLYLYNAEAGTLYGAASSKLTREAIRERVISLASAKGAQSLLDQRAAIAVCNIDKSGTQAWTPRLRRVLPVDLGGDAALVVPLTLQTRIHGLLVCADASTERVYSPEEILVVTQLADHAALALENARLLYESSRRLEDLRMAEEFHAASVGQAAEERERLIRRSIEQTRALEQHLQDRQQSLAALINISKAINASGNPETVLEQIMRSANSLMRAETCNFFVYSSSSDTFQGVVSSSMPRQLIQKLQFPASGSASMDGLLHSQGAVRLQDAAPDNMPMLHDAFRSKAALITPVVGRGKLLGIILCIDSDASRAFSQEQIELLGAFSDQAAHALETARLIYEAIHARSELDAARRQQTEFERLVTAEFGTSAAQALSQPLSIILNETRQLRKQALGPEIMQELELIETQTEHMGDIIEQIRQMSAAAAGREIAPTRRGARAPVDEPRPAREPQDK